MGLLESSCTLHQRSSIFCRISILSELTFPGGIERPHVEDVDALGLSKNFETLQTGRLLQIGGNSTGDGTGSDEVVNVLDV